MESRLSCLTNVVSYVDNTSELQAHRHSSLGDSKYFTVQCVKYYRAEEGACRQ